MYRYVEGTTATPFAARARDRVLHALVVSLLRLQVETMADNGGASRINNISDEQIKDIKDKILERVKITAPSSYVDTEKEMDEFTYLLHEKQPLPKPQVYDEPDYTVRPFTDVEEEYLQIYRTFIQKLH